MKTTHILRYGAAAFGTLLLVSAGTAVAVADEISYGDQDVDVTVEVPEIETPGVLALSVAADNTTLTENGSTDLIRQFTGTLPTVTVTDTRDPEEIASDAAWFVLGTASDFVLDGQAGTTIDAENLGWEPELVGGNGEPFISLGDKVDAAVDGGPGLFDQELLFLGESADAASGSWSAKAALTLRTGADATPGTYHSTITLSLFE